MAICSRCGYLLLPGSEQCTQCDRPVSGRDLLAPGERGTRESQPGVQRVSVVDVDMPFFSMVAFMLKWAIASVPALIILAMMLALLGAIFGAALAR